MSQLATGFLWTAVGLLLFYFLPTSAPKKLGRSLYWIGVPLQVLGLAHQSDFDRSPWLPPLMVVGVLIFGWGISILCLRVLKRFIVTYWKFANPWAIFKADAVQKMQKSLIFAQLIRICHRALPKDNQSRGSFILSAILGNTIFIGLAIVPSLVNPAYLGWIIIYGVVHYLLGSYGIGTLLASYFGREKSSPNWSDRLRDVATVPALWAFALGLLTRSLDYPDILDFGLQGARWMGVPAVFVLLGMQLGKFRGLQSLESAAIPAIIKILVLPLAVGAGLTIFGFTGDARLTLVLMAGMPTNSANLILAEEYDLDSQLAAGSILLSTIALPLLLPLWVSVFR